MPGYASMPSFVSINSNSLQITIYSNLTLDAGLYKSNIVATAGSGNYLITAMMPWNLTIVSPLYSVPTNTPPHFTSNLPTTPLQVQCGKTFVYDLPPIVDK